MKRRAPLARRALRWVGWLLWGLMVGELAWKHAMVVRFFRRPLPALAREPVLVSILIPVYSGDPTLPQVLAHNLGVRSRYPLEILFLLGERERDGQRICRDLIARAPLRPDRSARVLVVRDAGGNVNPKMVKLIAGARAARGDVLCVLDDDTRLPHDGLEQCLPFLDQPGVGLAFGLPYYTSFASFWEALVSVFVNSNSLLTYIPYTALSEPFTLNGMFYVLRREVYDALGGFAGLERFVSDDFAVARHLRAAGYRLAQAPMRHAISTTVRGPRQYFGLIQRWMLFPRESLLRYGNGRQRAIIAAVGLAPALYPLLLLVTLLARPSRTKAFCTAIWFGCNGAVVAHLNAVYLRGATPRRFAWLHPVVQLVFPIQLLVALCSPNRINWRGRMLTVERGGTFHAHHHDGTYPQRRA